MERVELVTDRCKACVYSGSIHKKSPTYYCIYILFAGHSRGCPAGDKCNKFIAGSKRVIDARGDKLFLVTYEDGRTERVRLKG